MNVYGKSDIGLVRKTNQDDIKFKKVADKTFWVVICDGMGGAKGGDIAGTMAANKISGVFDDYFKDDTKQENDIQEMMNSAVGKAGDIIYDTAKENSDLSGMGTTVVAAILTKNTLHVAHVGDSRAYIINSSGINQITKDHSIVQEMLTKGEITKEEAENHPQRNIITKALGIQKGIFPDYQRLEIDNASKVLFCTDGLTNELSETEIYEIFKSTKETEQIPSNLIKAANQKKGADNITVAVIG
jgi:Serine/threonine protein phosphatase